MSERVAEIRALRPDAVLLEMGTTGVARRRRPAVASYGATKANTRAALDVLRRPGPERPGRRVTMTAQGCGPGPPAPIPPGAGASADSPRLLREINDQVVLGLLLDDGPMTRGRIGEADRVVQADGVLVAHQAGGARPGHHHRRGGRWPGTECPDLCRSTPRPAT